MDRRDVVLDLTGAANELCVLVAARAALRVLPLLAVREQEGQAFWFWPGQERHRNVTAIFKGLASIFEVGAADSTSLNMVNDIDTAAHACRSDDHAFHIVQAVLFATAAAANSSEEACNHVIDTLYSSLDGAYSSYHGYDSGVSKYSSASGAKYTTIPGLTYSPVEISSYSPVLCDAYSSTPSANAAGARNFPLVEDVKSAIERDLMVLSRANQHALADKLMKMPLWPDNNKPLMILEAWLHCSSWIESIGGDLNQWIPWYEQHLFGKK